MVDTLAILLMFLPIGLALVLARSGHRRWAWGLVILLAAGVPACLILAQSLRGSYAAIGPLVLAYALGFSALGAAAGSLFGSMLRARKPGDGGPETAPKDGSEGR